DIALLAGDGLMAMGFHTVCQNPFVGEKQALCAAKLLIKEAGADGMMGGQCIDLESENKRISFDALLKMHAKKTGALIRAAACLGVIAAGITDDKAPEYVAACGYARGVGLSFQIIDDILDVVGDAAVLGKNPGSDLKDGKTTFLSFMSVDEARGYAETETEKAVAAISGYDGSEFLTSLAGYLISRAD
ncbi:MAG: polyprenyl synthetase family protein, partial [Clostridia bacterium]|nr:polyprenyl synthetase family protein [Clostridia bacterium]